MKVPLHLFKPVYGERMHVRPKHWWNPRQRRTARLAAKLLDHQFDALAADVSERMRCLMVYGHGFGTSEAMKPPSTPS